MDNDNTNAEEKFPCIIRGQFEELGTDIDIQIVVDNYNQENDAEKNIEEIKRLYIDFAKVFSRFDPESELSKFNAKIGKFNLASPHMCEVVSHCLEYNKKTQGLFDPRILSELERIGYADDFKKGIIQLGEKSNIKDGHSFLNRNLDEDLKTCLPVGKVENKQVFFGVRMDFSGIAKGYINDQIASFLAKNNWKNFLVDSGGDMFMRGVDEENKLWTVNIEGIDEKKLIFALDDKAIATSGIGKRRWEIEGKRLHHIINPKNPDNFSFDLKSVSVIANSTTEADVLAKTIFLMGRVDGMIYARENSIAVVILDYRGAACISPEAKEYLYNNV